MGVPQSVWVVIDPKDGPEFAAAWREGAHEHIKDCLDEGIHEAGRWVVREYALADELTRLRAENAALIADRDALRADAERYRYMRTEFTAMSMYMDGNHVWAYRRLNLRGPTLDAAIDAAIAGRT